LGIRVIDTPTLGEAWLAVSRAVLEEGELSVYEAQTTRELALVTLVVERPSVDDPVVDELGDPEWLTWMHENFSVEKEVPELGGADSYAVRLFNYAHTGRDQIAWVVERLREDPECRSATVTTFQPLTDEAYIPCISMLDFWLPAGELELIVYAHSLDFGKKAYGNLVELARLQQHVAGRLDVPLGRLIIHSKSAHVYEPEWELMTQLTGLAGTGASVDGRRIPG
jgi:thymidylate synthase